MLEQIHETPNHDNVKNGHEMKLESAVIFSNTVSCSTCGMPMQLVENDVIYGESWYHAKCWKEMRGGKQNV